MNTLILHYDQPMKHLKSWFNAEPSYSDSGCETEKTNIKNLCKSGDIFNLDFWHQEALMFLSTSESLKGTVRALIAIHPR